MLRGQGKRYRWYKGKFLADFRSFKNFGSLKGGSLMETQEVQEKPER
jgi:hypothetical protein